MVNDDEFLTKLYREKFQKAGFDFTELPDAGGDFVKNVFDIKPDIISLDIVMPKRDGYKAIQLLKKDARTRDIPVIFLSNLGQKEDIKQGMNLGAEDYFVPANIDFNEQIQAFTEYLSNPKGYKKRCLYVKE